MKVTPAPIYVAPLRLKTAARLADFVADPTHQIALTGTISQPLDAGALAQVALGKQVTLTAVPAEGKAWTPAQRLAITKAVANAVVATLPIIKSNFPGAGNAVEGLEFVFHTASAVHAWYDPKRKDVVKPLLKTSRALVELFDVLKLVAPGLGPAAPYVQHIGVLVKVGDTIYQFWTDVQDITKASKGK